MENELIVVEQRKVGNATIQTVNARDLHSFLESKQQFADWIKARISKYGFTENVDFVRVHGFMNGSPAVEYYPSINMAKEISMVERNAKGKDARVYFIGCEAKAKEINALPSAIDNTQLELQQSTQLTESLALLTESLRQSAEKDRVHSEETSRFLALLEAKQAPALPPSKPVHAPVTDHITCAHWLNRNKIKADWRLKDMLCSNVAAYYVSHGKPFERTENGYGLFATGQIERQYHLLVSEKQNKIAF